MFKNTLLCIVNGLFYSVYLKTLYNDIFFCKFIDCINVGDKITIIAFWFIKR